MCELCLYAFSSLIRIAICFILYQNRNNIDLSKVLNIRGIVPIYQLLNPMESTTTVQNDEIIVVQEIPLGDYSHICPQTHDISFQSEDICDICYTRYVQEKLTHTVMESHIQIKGDEKLSSLSTITYSKKIYILT